MEENKMYDDWTKVPYYQKNGYDAYSIVQHKTFNIGTIIRYLWRAGDKDPNTIAKDLYKAIGYLDLTISYYSNHDNDKIIKSGTESDNMNYIVNQMHILNTAFNDNTSISTFKHIAINRLTSIGNLHGYNEKQELAISHLNVCRDIIYNFIDTNFKK